MMQFLKQGNLSIPIVLMDHYSQLGLNETEFLTLLHIYRFIERGNEFPTIEEISDKMSINIEQCSAVLKGLIQTGFLTIEQVKNQQLISEIYSIEPLWEKLVQYLMREEQTVQEEKHTSESLYTIFEKEFGRPLSPFECETLVMWEEQEQHPLILIKAALRESVMSGKLNFRYIDRILFEWKKNGIQTLEQAQQQGRKFRQHQRQNPQQPSTQNSGTVPFYNWLEQ